MARVTLCKEIGVMKEIILKISKGCISLFCICMLILIAFLVGTRDKMQQIPIIVLGIFILVLIATTVCILIAFIFSMIEEIQRGKILQTLGQGGMLLALCGGYILWQYQKGIEIDGIALMVRAIIIGCGLKAGTYIFQSKN